MKLIFCPMCGDAFALRFNMKTCECGSSWGHYYEDDPNEEKAIFGGEAIPFGIGNGLFHIARRGEAPTFFGWFYDSPWFDGRIRIKENWNTEDGTPWELT